MVFLILLQMKISKYEFGIMLVKEFGFDSSLIVNSKISNRKNLVQNQKI